MTILHSIDKPYMRLHNPILSCGNEYIGGLKIHVLPDSTTVLSALLGLVARTNRVRQTDS